MASTMQQSSIPLLNEDTNKIDKEAECKGDADKAKVDIRISDLTYEDILGLEFDSEVDANNFYCKYALFKGFGVRLSDVGKNCKGEIIWRKFVCICEGYRSNKYIEKPNRKREHKAITRKGCNALLYVRLDKSKKNGLFVNLLMNTIMNSLVKSTHN